MPNLRSCRRGSGVRASAARACARVVALTSVALGCSRQETPPAPAVAPVQARALAAPAAFDLVPTPDGAALAWASREAPFLVIERFDRVGVQSRAARVPVGSSVAEVGLAAPGPDLALGWIETRAEHASVRAAWIGAAEPQIFDLGAAASGAGERRGSLALAARAEGATLLARGLDTPCGDAAASACVGFQFFSVEASGARATGLPLTVPSPCDSRAAQLVAAPVSARPDAVAGQRFEYAVCSRAHAEPALTVFSIQSSPAYAMADEVLRGCEPLGAGRFAGRGAFVAACEKERRMATVAADGVSWETTRLGVRGLVCSASGAALRMGSEWLRLSEPLGNLELLLDDALAPPGSRAVWTGAALLVASADDGRLRLRRHVCRSTALYEESATTDAGL